jgi:hypothetical protein
VNILVRCVKDMVVDEMCEGQGRESYRKPAQDVQDSHGYLARSRRCTTVSHKCLQAATAGASGFTKLADTSRIEGRLATFLVNNGTDK